MPPIAYPAVMAFAPLSHPIDCVASLPGSKSITNRALLIAALADGTSVLRGALRADDTDRMIDCLRALGVGIDCEGDDGLLVAGAGGRLADPGAALFVGNSGTTIRFLTAAAPLAPAGCEVVLDGIERMRQRPIGDLVDALVQLGADSRCLGANGCPPVRVRGGGLPGGSCRLRGSITSQYLSALLMSAPLARSDVRIEIDGDLASKPYLDMTTSVMASFGVTIAREGYERFVAPSGRGYAAREYEIEPDASNATYFLAAAALSGGRVAIDGLGSASIQGDIAFADVLRAIGCAVDVGEGRIVVTGPGKLRAIDAALDAIPDTAQTAAVLALFSDGPSRLRGLSTLRVKETDRIAALASELRKLGAQVEATDDSLTISPPLRPTPAAIDTYDDHRMAMSFAVASLRIPDLVINDPGCVAKTFPDFWRRWQASIGNVAMVP